MIASANTGPRPNQPSPSSEAIEEVDRLNNDCNVSVSSNKLANTPIALLREESSDPLTVFKLFDVRLLIKSLESAFICKHCQNENTCIRMRQNDLEREGLVENLAIECENCFSSTPIIVSDRLGGKGGGASELNVRSVLASISIGHAELERFCGIMGLPPPVSKRAYNEHLKKIRNVAVDTTYNVMIDAANRLRDIIEEEEPSKVYTDEGGRKIVDVAVTVDGTWQKRGHTSRIGVVFVMAVRTGEVLDYVIKSLSCHECRCHEKDNKSSPEYQLWYENHKQHCEINHFRSSGEMEAIGASELFLRSIETRSLRYTQFVGDGDSSSFGKVKVALEQKFGDKYPVETEECVGHVQKRLGTALREYKKQKKGLKLNDGNVVSGKGRLTKVIIDKMQNYYGLAIRNNIGNQLEMKRSIKAIYHHLIKSEKLSSFEQHQYCPKERTSWCKFWRQEIFQDATYSDDKMLPSVFFNELRPIFEKLSKDELLSRCLKGFTQNQNESLNSQLWDN